MKYIVLIFVLLVSCNKNSEFDLKSHLTNASVLSTPKQVDLTGIEYESTSKSDSELLSSNHINLVFFGFPGCHGVCPVTMGALNEEIKAMDDDTRKKMKVLFVNVDETASKTQVEEFLAGFEFLSSGVLPSSPGALKALARQFGAYSRQALPSDKSTEKFIHSNMVFVVDSQKRWQGYYKFPIEKGQLAGDFKAVRF